MSPIPFFGEISALLTALCWAGSSLVFTAASTRVGSVLVNISRLVLALGYLALFLLLVPVSREISGAQIGYLAASGVVGLALGDSFLFRAYLSIGPRLSMLVMSIAPAISAVLAFVVLGEGISLLGVMGMAVTVAGVVLVIYDRGPGSLHAAPGVVSGLLCAGVAAIGQGVGLVLAKLAFGLGPIDGFCAAAVRIASALVILLPLMIVLGRLAHPIRTFAADRRAFGLTALGSVLGPFLGITLSLLAVANTSVGIAATLMATVPIILLPLVHFIHKEKLTWKAILGAFIAVGGVAMLFLR